MQDLARIKAFVQVHEAGGFSAAAREHGRSKALLSKFVTDLEDHLGVRLMNRTTRRLSLTEAGETYYREVSQLLQQLDELDATVSDQTSEPRGLVRVSAARNFGEALLAPAVFAFLTRHPAVSLDLRLEDRFVDLVDEGIDLALRITSATDSSLIARRIAPIEVALVASPPFLAQHGTPMRAEDLRGLPCIIDTNVQGYANWRLVDAGRPVTVRVGGRVRVNSPVAASGAALAGLGVGAVPRFLVAPMLADGRLVEILPEARPEAPSLLAVYAHRRHLPGKVRALIDHLVAWFEAHPIA